MNRLLATTAVALLLGLNPVLAQTQDPANEAPQVPAMQAPAQPSEIPSQPSMQPSMKAPDRSSEAAKPEQSTEAVKPAEPERSAQFLNEQKSTDWLATDLIGKPAVNGRNETIGDVNDLVTDSSGKIIAALIGVGGFLGIGEKDVAVRFEDLKLARDENNNVEVVLNINKEALASAPDYKTLDEQPVVEGSNKSDREDKTRTY